MTNQLPISNIRANNLKAIIDSEGFKSMTAFAQHFGLFTSNLSLILNGSREFTDRLARNIEIKIGLEPGALDKVENTNTAIESKHTKIMLEAMAVFYKTSHEEIINLAVTQYFSNQFKNDMSKASNNSGG